MAGPSNLTSDRYISVRRSRRAATAKSFLVRYSPPSTVQTGLVTYDAISETRLSSIDAISASLARRPSGFPIQISSNPAGVVDRRGIGVSTGPGMTVDPNPSGSVIRSHRLAQCDG